MSAEILAARHLKEHVCHVLDIDLFKLEREYDPRFMIAREQAAGFDFGPFHQQWLLARAPEKVRRILAEKERLRGIGLMASSQGFTSQEIDFASSTLRAAIASTTTETNLWDPAIFAPLPIGSIRAGKGWKIAFGGVHGTTATPTIQWRTRIGTNNSAPPTGTDLGLGATMTLGTFTAQAFHGEGIWGVRSVGTAASTATMAGGGFVIHAGAAAASTVATCVFGWTSTPTTIDQTVAQGIGVSMIWGTNSASNTLTPHNMIFQSTN